MGFPTRLLLEGETVALDLRPHWWFFAGPLAAGIPLLALLVGVLTTDGDIRTAGLWMVAVASAAWAVWLGGRLARWSRTHFVVTSERLVYRTGVLSKQGLDIPLDRVSNIASSQTLRERILRSGDLLIESAGEQGQQRFHDISRPDDVQAEIYRQIDRDARSDRRGGPPAPVDVPAQIAALAGLRDQGLLTEAEFQAKKSDLLSRM
ncbi:MAG: PH domain-containing protein [Acidimicrobiia bacterium]